MKFSSKILFLCAGIFAVSAFNLPANDGNGGVVAVKSGIEAIIRQGVLPVRIESSDRNLGNLVRYALNFHGAFDTNAPQSRAAVIRVSSDGNSLSATTPGTNNAFSGTLTVDGTDSNAAAKLCDKIVVAVGKKYGWNLKPVFAKTRLAFSSSQTGAREIYFSDLLFRSIRQATHHKRIAIMPNWDPSGTRLLYTTYHASGAADVYSVNLSTGAFSKFAAYPNTNNGGAFSPDGSKVALALSARGVMNIYLKPAKGGKAVSLCRDEQVQTTPIFSPDGKTVLFTSGPNGRPNLYTVPVSGGKKTHLKLPGFSYVSDPTWSRTDPAKIAFSYMRSGRGGIGIYDLNTKKVRDLGALIPGGRKFSNPTWCADGRHVVAVEEAGKNSFLVIMDTDGGDRAKVTRISPSRLKDCYDPDALVID